MKKMYIYNWQQAYFYMIDCGITPLEKPEINDKTGKVFFTFDKNETEEAYSKWCNRIR